jgi:hypothetical protein
MGVFFCYEERPSHAGLMIVKYSRYALTYSTPLILLTSVVLFLFVVQPIHYTRNTFMIPQAPAFFFVYNLKRSTLLPTELL